ncbi:MAG: YajD family HNH nuclease [Candidatus Accumulibacter sp.]|nr:YajD family HNH nuclease [Accumulibacter sp.]
MDSARTDRLIAEAVRARHARERGYRERALKIHPWVCGRCGREFSRENVSQLTVHHRDHDHDNNPPDGSNWELLCIYCHENEHARELDAEAARQAGADDSAPTVKHATSQPFANLKELLRQKTEDRR